MNATLAVSQIPPAHSNVWASLLSIRWSTLRRLLLEDSETPPLAVKWARVLRLATLAVMFVAVYVVLYTGLVDRQTALGTLAKDLFRASFFTLVHLVYLWIVFWLLILSQPLEKLYWQRAVIPALLFAAYLLYAAHAFVLYELQITGYDRPLFVGSYILFFILYAVWAFRDWVTWREPTMYRERPELFLWGLFEVVVLSFLALRILLEFVPSFVLQLPPGLTIIEKDGVVTLCVLMWIVAKMYAQQYVNRSFHETYVRYIDANRIVTKPSFTFDSKPRACLDFGCGDGARMVQILEYLGVACTSDTIVVGLDSDGSWRNRYLGYLRRELGTAPEISFITSVGQSRLRPEEYDLVVLSHVLYYPRLLKAAIAFLRRCRPGTNVVVRGSSPRSFFITSSRAFASRLWAPPTTHLWHTASLAQLIREATLVRAPSGGRDLGKPDARIGQELSLMNGGPEAAGEFLRYLYGDATGGLATRYFESLRAEDGVLSIPNDDWLYLFTIGAARVGS